MSHRNWQFRLQDMLNAARKIEDYVEGMTFEGFTKDEKTFDAVIRQLTILGEAALHVEVCVMSSCTSISGPTPLLCGKRP